MLYKEKIVINLYLPINTAADYIKKIYEKYENLSKNTIKLGNLGLHLQIRLNWVNKNKIKKKLNSKNMRVSTKSENLFIHFMTPNYQWRKPNEYNTTY